MAKILVYNNYSNRMETYNRTLNQAMPYVTNFEPLVIRQKGICKKLYPQIHLRFRLQVYNPIEQYIQVSILRDR